MLSALLVKFRRDPLQGTIILSVLLVHLLFLLIILVAPTFIHRKKEHKPLIVKTIVPKSVSKTIALEKNKPRAAPASTPKAAAPKPAAPQTPPQTKKQESPHPEVKKKESPKAQTKKEPAPAPAIVKKPAAKPTPAVKKEPAIADKTLSPSKQPAKKNPPPQNRAKISDSLLQELEESIAKIETKSDKSAVGKKASAPLKAIAPIALQIDSVSGGDNSSDDGESDYADLLVGHLHRSLSLPEYGEVKIQLSLRQDGSVAKVIVLKTQSEKNRQYLESNLLRLKFPRFEGVYSNKKEHTFVLTFCNEL
ncbi:MAG: hypothetical protein JSS60_06715 [Verrucomicrobia bacterium]|nr:hypothetical protein [Verrucomicrobiota bacterium]